MNNQCSLKKNDILKLKRVICLVFHLFTGFPGFIATQLMKELVKQRKTENFFAVVHVNQLELAKERVESIRSELGSTIEITLLPGDITKEELGLTKKSLELVQQQPLIVWHLAAIYDLAVKAPIAWSVNVEGTRRVNEFVANHPSILRYMYFSTAYVAGKREGQLLESELIKPVSFKNHYEETKFEAELLVEALKSSVPVTIIRPGIVRGDSKTGETIKFDGPYFFMNMIDRLRWLPFIPYVGKSEASLNVVPIDYILAASVYLSHKDEAEGKTVHLTDPSPHRIEEIYGAMVLGMTGKKAKGRLPYKLAEKSLSFVRLQRLLGVEAETLDYLTWQGSFDTSVAEELLQGSEIQCADFLESLPVMTEFYEKNKKNKAYHIKIG